MSSSSSLSLVDASLAQIAAKDRQGPRFSAVLSLNPRARDIARKLDEERAAGRIRSPLHGLPILVKDNIETGADSPTTAGSLALAKNAPDRKAPVIERLEKAGLVILGKSNLSEWAAYRDGKGISGWSALGGQTRNAKNVDFSPCGSSSGSAVAVAAGYVDLAIGTETNGSIICPAAVNGVVGLKPTVGLISRTHIIPISQTMDTAGPIAANVALAAQALSAMAGSDPKDPATRQADTHKMDYATSLKTDVLKGRRLGVLRFAGGVDPATEAVFEKALNRLLKAGAELVEIRQGPFFPFLHDLKNQLFAMEFQAGINAYLDSTLSRQVAVRDLSSLIRFNEAHADKEMPFFGQDLFERALGAAALDSPNYLNVRTRLLRLAREEGIDLLLKKHRVEAFVAPSLSPAWPITGEDKTDHYLGGDSILLAAAAGYPHLTVPMGTVRGLPVGLSFLGPAWSEARILAFGFAFEQSGP